MCSISDFDRLGNIGLGYTKTWYLLKIVNIWDIHGWHDHDRLAYYCDYTPQCVDSLPLPHVRSVYNTNRYTYAYNVMFHSVNHQLKLNPESRWFSTRGSWDRLSVYLRMLLGVFLPRFVLLFISMFKIKHTFNLLLFSGFSALSLTWLLVCFFKYLF